MNVDDSERMLSFLRSTGFKAVEEITQAELILVNTCSVRDKAEQKVYSTLGRYKAFKKARPELVIGVCGCVAQQFGARLLERVAYLDMVVGTHNIHLLPKLVERVAENGERIDATEFRDSIGQDEYDATPTPGRGMVKATVSIMRGCDNFCSYCIVPYVRGREMSRSPEDVLSEVDSLAESGVREVTLLGQNVNSYCGVSRQTGSSTDFPALLKLVCRREGIERVRFVTSHPKDISTELMGLFGVEPKLASHVHLPVQSGSDEVLKRMKRGYTRAEYMGKIRALREACPDVAITTDIIVGFPGESEEDFERTIEVVREVGYDGAFSFKYSPRPGTEAAAYDDQLPSEVKSERLERLQKLERELRGSRDALLEGSVMEVLIEGPSKASDEELTGRTNCNRVVNFPSPAPEVAQAMTGTISEVLITRAYANSLRGRISERSMPCSIK